MKKIVIFGRLLPDVVDKVMHEKKLNRFSPELIAMVESARDIAREAFDDSDVMNALKRSGELFRCVGSGLVYGYNSNFKTFGTIAVDAYDESHRHMIDEYDGDEALIDLDAIEREPGTSEEYNLWRWKRN